MTEPQRCGALDPAPGTERTYPAARQHTCGRPQHSLLTPHVCGVCGHQWGGEL